MDSLTGHNLAFQAARLTLKNLPALLRCIWPILAVMAFSTAITSTIGTFKVSANFREDLISSLAILGGGLAALVYLLVMTSSGAVLWHRFVAFDVRPRWASLIPMRAAWPYTGYVIIFALILLVLLALPTLVVGPFVARFMSGKIAELNLTSTPTVDQLQALQNAMLAVSLGWTLVGLLIVLLWLSIASQWLLIFPYVALVRDRGKYLDFYEGVNPPRGIVGALFLVYLVLTLLGLIYQYGVPIRWQLQSPLIVIVGTLNLLLSLFSLAIHLAILSLSFVYATGGTDRRATPQYR